MKVQTEDGEKEIQDIEVGDGVWAYGEAGGRWVLAPVTRVFRRLLVGTILVLAFAWGELEVTPEHPFYVVHGQGLEARETPGLRASRTASGVWVAAGDLRAGDVIHSRTGPAPLIEVHERVTREWVYNLEVRGPHTFTVGAAGLVVHNTCYENALAAAKEQYPHLAGKTQKHHRKPRYLGGADDGPIVEIDAAYHQMITNEFRKYVPYGSSPPSAEKVAEIME